MAMMSHEDLNMLRPVTDALIYALPGLSDQLDDIQAISDTETRKETAQDVIRGLASHPAIAEAAGRAGVSRSQLLIALGVHHRIKAGGIAAMTVFVGDIEGQITT